MKCFKQLNFKNFFLKNKNKFTKLIIKPTGALLLLGIYYNTISFSNKSFCENLTQSKNYEDNPITKLEPNKSFDKKYFDINISDKDIKNTQDSIIYIIYDKTNLLQCELKEIIFEKLKNYINSKDFIRNKIILKLVEKSDTVILNNLTNNGLKNYEIESENADNIINIKPKNIDAIENNLNYIDYKINNLSISNEPIVLIKSGLCIENINSLSFFKDQKNSREMNKKINFYTKSKLDNIFFYNYCDEMHELREHFRYLEKPENKIILISSENYFSDFSKSEKNNHYINNKSTFEYNKFKILSTFKEKNTKIIFINNKKLIDYLKLDKDLLYVYYPPKMPNIMKNVELFLQENKLTQRYEGIDLNKLFNLSPMNFILKFNFFRDEIKINTNKIFFGNEKIHLENIQNLTFNKFERIKLLKFISYPKKQVKQLANTEKKLFSKSWSQPNKNILFVYVPNWSFLKESIFNFILYDANHLFDEIQITNSRNFTVKNKIYDNSQISDDLPQLFIIESGENGQNKINLLENKKIYSFNFFRFSNELQNYLRNKHPIYRRQVNVDNLTNVSFVNSKNFKSKILEDKKLKEFILEIKHEGCPSCFMLGKMFDHLSLKFKKHKCENKIKFFRIDTENDLRFLGEFAATPTYLFCKKNEKGEITFVAEIPKPEFIFRIKKYSNYDLSKIKYHPNLYFGFQVYQSKEFLKPDFDPDMDINGYQI